MRVYFIPSKSEGAHQCHAKGKLIERWKNVARRLRSVGAIELGRQKTTSNSYKPAAVFSDDLKAAKLWLQEEGLSANFDSVKDKWRLTYSIRKSEILNPDSKVTVCDVFLNWPILKSPRGNELVCEDFNVLYPNQQELFPDWSSFLNKWIFITDRLVSVRKNSVKDKVAKDLLKQLDNVQQSGNNHLCYFNCPLKAIDSCFKSYFSFNCAYPRECHESWMFLQLYMYGLNTDHDLMTAVLSSINGKHHSSSSLTVTDQVNDQNLCSLESNTQPKINVNIPYNDITNLKLSSADQNVSTRNNNYEILEESILLNELVNFSPTSNFGDEHQSIYSIQIKKCVLNFIAKLLMKPNVTSSLLQDIIEGVIDIFSSGIVSDLQNMVMPIIRNCCNISQSSEIGDMFYLLENAFVDVKTEYLRTKFLLKNKLFFKPETIVVGHVKEKKNS
ncbi:hypothetical protein ACI65C_013649 [Semiaphis heraclei]